MCVCVCRWIIQKSQFYHIFIIPRNILHPRKFPHTPLQLAIILILGIGQPLSFFISPYFLLLQKSYLNKDREDLTSPLHLGQANLNNYFSPCFCLLITGTTPVERGHWPEDKKCSSDVYLAYAFSTSIIFINLENYIWKKLFHKHKSISVSIEWYQVDW